MAVSTYGGKIIKWIINYIKTVGVIKFNTCKYNDFDIVVKKQLKPVAIITDTNFEKSSQ